MLQFRIFLIILLFVGSSAQAMTDPNVPYQLMNYKIGVAGFFRSGDLVLSSSESHLAQYLVKQGLILATNANFMDQKLRTDLIREMEKLVDELTREKENAGNFIHEYFTFEKIISSIPENSQNSVEKAIVEVSKSFNFAKLRMVLYFSDFEYRLEKSIAVHSISKSDLAVINQILGDSLEVAEHLKQSISAKERPESVDPAIDDATQIFQYLSEKPQWSFILEILFDDLDLHLHTIAERSRQMAGVPAHGEATVKLSARAKGLYERLKQLRDGRANSVIIDPLKPIKCERVLKSEGLHEDDKKLVLLLGDGREILDQLRKFVTPIEHLRNIGVLKKHIVDLEGNIRSHGLDWSISEFDLILASVELKLKTEKIYREYSKKGPQAKAAALKFKSWAGKLIKFADDYGERKQWLKKEG